MSNPLQPHGVQHARLPWSITIPWSLSRFMFIELVMLSNHLILCHPLLLWSSISPSIRVFSSESALCIRGPKYWNLSISHSNEYSEFISFRIWSPCILRESQESSPAPQLENISSSALSLLYGPALTSIHDYWKNHSFDDMNLFWQSDVSTF